MKRNKEVEEWKPLLKKSEMHGDLPSDGQCCPLGAVVSASCANKCVELAGNCIDEEHKDKGGLIRQKKAKQHRKTIYRVASGEPCRIDV